MSDNAQPLTGNKLDDKEVAEKLKTFAKNVSVNIINEATDKDGLVDNGLVVTGVALAMDSIFDVMSGLSHAKKSILITTFCRMLIENI